MGLLDITSRVLTEFKADTSDMKAKLKELQDEEKELAKQQIAAAESRNQGLQSWVSGLANAGLAMNAVTGIVNYLDEAQNRYADNLRLEMAASKANIEELSSAFDGLVSRHDMLQFAAKGLHGAVALNQEQMNTLAKGAVYFAREGLGTTKETMEKLEDAAVTLRTRGLHELGLEVKEGATQQETLKNILDAVQQKMREGGPIAETQADAIQRTSAAWADFRDNIDHASASLIETLPIMEMFNQRRKYFVNNPGETVDLGIDYDWVNGGKSSEADDPWVSQANVTSAGVTRGIVALVRLATKFEKFGEAQKKAREAALKAFEERKKLADATQKTLTDDLVKQLQGELEANATYHRDQRTEQEQLLGDYGVDLEAQLNAKMPAKAPSMIEKIFGKKEEINEYKEVLAGLFSSAAAGLDAMIIGSDSGAKAFAKSMGSILHSLALKEMTVGFAYEGEAVADLIGLDPVKAAADAAAGAKYLAIGAAIDAVAGQLGYGSSTPSLSSGGGSSSAGGGSFQSKGDSTQDAQARTTERTVYVVGDPNAQDSPRMQRANLQRQLDRLQGASGVAFK
jgi:hypothetical protein